MGVSKLLTVLGNRAYDEMVYALGGKRSSKVKCAPLALLELLEWPGGVKVVAFLTKQAACVHEAYLRQEVEARGHELVTVSIPAGSNEREIWDIFNAIAQHMGEGDELAVDLTHGFRSLPILMLGALIFLKEARNLTLKGLFYGALEARGSEDSVEPIFDLSKIVDMVEMAHGARIFRKYGHADELGGILARIQDEVRKGGAGAEAPKKLKSLGEILRELSAFLAEGCPLEIGNAAFKLRRLDMDLVKREIGDFAPPVGLLLDEIVSGFGGMANCEGGLHGNWKAKVALDFRELLREAEVVDWYLGQGQERLVLALMREWMVNRVILSMGKGEDWLNYSQARKPAERRLNVLVEMRRQGHQMSPAQKVLSEWWKTVAERRNAIAHCGFKKEILSSTNGNIRETWQEMKNRLLEEQWWDVSRWNVEAGPVLLSPLGLSRGLLYSAIRQVRPVKLFVLTSKEAEGAIPEILERAQWTGAPPNIFTMNDPHTGFGEAEGLKAGVVPSLLVAEKVVANQTGGTTVMQFVIQSICKELEKYDVPLEQIALVDRRPPEQQRKDPYQLGDLIRLDQTESRCLAPLILQHIDISNEPC